MRIKAANDTGAPQGSTVKRWSLKVLLLGLVLLSACSGGGGGVQGSTVPLTPSWAAVDLPINLIESVAINPLDRRVVYAGQRNPSVNAEHAVWRSDDGGESFKVVAQGVSFHLFPSPTDPDRVFGTAMELDRYFGGQALYVSRDRGQNWQQAFKDGKGILLSSDHLDGRGIGQHPWQRDTIYAAGRLRDSQGWGIFKSIDGGVTWSDVSPQGFIFRADLRNFAFDPLHVDTVFFSARFIAPNGTDGVLLRTADGGKSWQGADAGLLVRSSEGSVDHILRKLVVTTVPGVLIGYSGQLWINSDGGAGTWRPMPLPGGSGDQFLWSAQMPNTLVVLNLDGTMQRSDDLGSSWSPVATPGKISASSLDDSDPLGILITTTNDEALYRTVDAGQTWTLLPKPQFSVSYYTGDGYPGNRIAVSVATPDHLIALTSYGSLQTGYRTLPHFEVLAGGQWQMPRSMAAFRSTVAVTSIAAFGNRLATVSGGTLIQQDLQGTWGRVSQADAAWSEGARLSSDGERWGMYGGLYIVPASHGSLGSKYIRTTDGGAHWAGGYSFNDGYYGYHGNYSGEAVFDTPNGRFWYLSTFNKISYQVFLTQPDGSFKSASAGLPTGALNALANSPQAPSRLYVGTPQGIYRSTDGGSLWNPAFAGNSGSPVSAIAVDPKDAMTVWTLGANGLARSNDGGDHWVAVAPEHFASGAGTLALHPSRSGVVVVSAADGIWLSVDAGAKWQNVGGPVKGVRQLMIVDDAINAATDSGLFRCASLCQQL